ncbi:MAG: tetratricopeptide repeat protein [Candidatus Subteraquimicrobiales bacterium]|nr:tetratricopeptide repeat protein [Candidatus Subteraquimicrobiales bacterium]
MSEEHLSCSCPHHHKRHVSLKDRALMLFLVVVPLIFILRPFIAMQSLTRANSYLELGFFERAIVHYKRAVFMDSNLALAHSYLGFAYSKTDQVKLAKESLKKAVELNPEDPQPILELILMLNQEGKINEAISLYEEVKDKVKDDPTLLQLVAQVYEKAEEKEKAIDALEKVLEILPDSVSAKERLKALKGEI